MIGDNVDYDDDDDDGQWRMMSLIDDGYGDDG
jgi:hypothetical protein